MANDACLTTSRLEIRRPVEADRDRFVELFSDEAFMVFSGGVCDEAAANARFDRMVTTAATVPFSKRPIRERGRDEVLGYSGVAFFEFEGGRHLEFGYRLCVEARGKGYATEAGLALLDAARESFSGTLLAMIDPTNEPSMNVIAKLGFTFWKQAVVGGFLDNLYRIELP